MRGGSIVEVLDEALCTRTPLRASGNTPGSARLDGSDITNTPGHVAGPNLVSATIDTTNQSILYLFDKAIDPASLVGGRCVARSATRPRATTRSARAPRTPR